ncbi:glycosyltransferase [Acidisoma sp. L85]|uniref:glycosyltransferase family 2 protein n=1 Tax=Acidisoma sp. L85 TaxID=1641850 RepID=UPI00131D3D0A|nr:glycosyltransferase [Acidisoma sp. L85]
MTLSGFFDTVYGGSLYGWARDDADPTPVWVEAVTEDGQVLGTAKADIFRDDLLLAGLGDGCCAYKIDINGNITDLVDAKVSTRQVGRTSCLAGSPITIQLNPNFQYLLTRGTRAQPVLNKLRARLDREAGTDAISIIMPVFNTPQAWLIEALESVRAQWCSRWELICVDDGSAASHVLPILRGYAKIDERIRILQSPHNVGTAKATNFGLRAAKYDYVVFMDHDDYLEPHAIWRLIRAVQKSKADLLYSDEVVTSDSIEHILDIRARPAFSYDYYLSHPYFVHLVCVKREIAYRVGGWNEELAISADVDFVLRVIEHANTVAHVPSVLYRWRTHGNSAGHSKQEAVTTTTTMVLQRHLDRTGTKATASPGISFNQYRISWPIPEGRTLIVVPTKNSAELLQKCITSIEETVYPNRYRLVVVDHQSDDRRTKHYLRQTVSKRHIVMPYKGNFNFSRMNNLAVQQHSHGCEFVLFLNNDVEATEKGWLERMTSLAARPGIGIVGPSLLFGDRRIQHAGVIVGYSDAAEHVGKFVTFEDEAGARTLGANCTLTSVRDFSAVTGACLMMRLSVFQEVGGFREEFPVAFNDTDMCLRVRDLGYRVLYDGHTSLYHHESATRTQTNDLIHPEDTKLFQKRWKHLMHGADPFYHPFLSLTVQDHILAERLIVAPASPRIVNTSPLGGVT